MKKLMIVAVLLVPGLAWSLTVTPTGTTGTVAYQEPNTNEDGTPLNDLAYTTIYSSNSNNPAVVVLSSVTATSPNGNGVINKQVNLNAVTGKVITYTIWATATDTSGNESLPSNPDTVVVDRLKPGKPK